MQDLGQWPSMVEYVGTVVRQAEGRKHSVLGYLKGFSYAKEVRCSSPASC